VVEVCLGLPNGDVAERLNYAHVESSFLAEAFEELGATPVSRIDRHPSGRSRDVLAFLAAYSLP
jgi:hypothetical protein